METKNLVGIRFKKQGKIFFYDPNNIELKINDNVIAETSMGKEFAIVVIANRPINISIYERNEIRNIIRKADEKDKKINEENLKKNIKAFEICKSKIKKYNLEMNLVEAKYLFDQSKLLFYFTSEQRIDFRTLVKDLAQEFRTRIELRQISVRDQVKRLGGNGICGRELCCCSYLSDYGNVSIKYAKEQNLSLNVSKITGNCGRLMCCLRNEKNVYDDKMKKLPHPGATVDTKEDGRGIVDNVEVMSEIIRVKLKDNDGNDYYKKFNLNDLKIIKDTENDISNEERSIDELKELEKLEKLDKLDKKNASKDEE